MGYSKTYSQKANLDSLQKALAAAKSDTERINTKIRIFRHFVITDRVAAKHLTQELLADIAKETNSDHKQRSCLKIGRGWLDADQAEEALPTIQIGIDEARKTKSTKYLSELYYLMSHCWAIQFSPSKALMYNDSAFDYLPAGNIAFEAKLLRDKGRNYYDKEDYTTALHFMQQSQDIYEKHHIMTADYGQLLHFVGSVFKRIKNYEQSLEYYERMIRLAKEIKDLSLEAEGLSLAADMYSQMENYAQEVEYLSKAVQIAEQQNDYASQIMYIVNLSHFYIYDDNSPKALSFLDKAVAIGKEHNINQFDFNINRYYGKIYGRLKQYDKAGEYLETALKIAETHEEKRLVKMCDALRSLASLKYKAGDYKAAYEYYEDCVYYTDSLAQQNNAQLIQELDGKYQSEKKEAQIKLLNTEKENQELVIKNQKNVRIGLIVGLIVLALFIAFVYNRYKITLRQRDTIEQQRLEVITQKEIVEFKNVQILESINCALRVQNAILPPTKIVKQYLQNSFVLYMPKDIIAGDFYWMEAPSQPPPKGEELMRLTHNEDTAFALSPLGRDGEGLGGWEGSVLFAACDCTGHGVSGAMVSVVCNNALNRAVREFGITEPAKILDKVSEIVVENFSKSENEISDGMDASLCLFNPETNMLQWAGANNPLWIVRKGELIEVKGNNQGVGKYDDASLPFTNHTIQLEKGDSIYVFSDGYADQFGGEPERKLTKRRFKELVLSMQDTPMFEQGNFLRNYLEEFKGNKVQVDDILVMGVRV